MSTLKKYRERSAIYEGCDPEICRSFRDFCNNKPSEITHGHIIVDEMKLKNNVCANILTGAVTGFSSSNMDFDSIKDEVASIAKDDLSENNSQKEEDTEPNTNSKDEIEKR